MYKMIDNLDKNTGKVIKKLFEKPRYGFHIRELARMTGLNPNTISNIIKKIEQSGLVETEKKKNIVEIRLNYENKQTNYLKRVYNLKEFYDSGVLEFLIKFDPRSVVLMGSYSRGEDIEKSDIDIVFVGECDKKINLDKFEKILKKKIHLIIAKTEEMSEEFFNNLINGIVVYGAIRK